MPRAEFPETGPAWMSAMVTLLQQTMGQQVAGVKNDLQKLTAVQKKGSGDISAIQGRVEGLETKAKELARSPSSAVHTISPMTPQEPMTLEAAFPVRSTPDIRVRLEALETREKERARSSSSAVHTISPMTPQEPMTPQAAFPVRSRSRSRRRRSTDEGD